MNWGKTLALLALWSASFAAYAGSASYKTEISSYRDGALSTVLSFEERKESNQWMLSCARTPDGKSKTALLSKKVYEKEIVPVLEDAKKQIKECTPLSRNFYVVSNNAGGSADQIRVCGRAQKLKSMVLALKLLCRESR